MSEKTVFRRARWGVLLLALMLTGWAWLRVDTATDVASVGGHAEAGMAHGDAVTRVEHPPKAASSVTHSTETHAIATRSDWQANYGCAKCAPGFAIASSAADAAWLAQHGYPSSAQRQAYSSLSEAELEARGNAGDSIALGQLGDRMMLRGDGRLYDVYEHSAALGSLYALYRLADVYERSKSPSARNQAAALLRLASMQGDYYGARELQQRFARLGSADLLLVDQQAQQLLEQLTQRRQQMGLGPLTLQPRPGLRESLQTATAQ